MMQPAKLYYFSVVGYFSSTNSEVNSTRSAASFGVTTEVLKTFALTYRLVCVCVCVRTHTRAVMMRTHTRAVMM